MLAKNTNLQSIPLAPKALVLGAGLIGPSIAGFLAEKGHVTITDINYEALIRAQKLFNRMGVQPDIFEYSGKEADTRRLIHEHDLTVNALPGKFGHAMLRTIIDEQRAAVDISFGEEDAFVLDDLAKQKGIPVAVDCGVAPGMSHMLIGYADSLLNGQSSSARIDVGGLPQEPKAPHFYQAPFAPESVIDEYLRSAGYMKDGTVLWADPLADIQVIDVPDIGSFEAFRSDGLRTLLKTMSHIRNMTEWTLRNPGHLALMKKYRNEERFAPEALPETIQELKQAWALGNDPDRTVMRVHVANDHGNQVTFTLEDQKDMVTNMHSMARTTGLTAALVARRILDGNLTTAGILAPETLGRDHDFMRHMFNGMHEQGIEYRGTRTYNGMTVPLEI